MKNRVILMDYKLCALCDKTFAPLAVKSFFYRKVRKENTQRTQDIKNI